MKTNTPREDVVRHMEFRACGAPIDDADADDWYASGSPSCTNIRSGRPAAASGLAKAAASRGQTTFRVVRKRALEDMPATATQRKSKVATLNVAAAGEAAQESDEDNNSSYYYGPHRIVASQPVSKLKKLTGVQLVQLVHISQMMLHDFTFACPHPQCLTIHHTL